MLMDKKSADKDIRNDVYYKFGVVARYLYHNKEWKPKAIRAELTALAERLDKNYDESYWTAVITKILNGKYKKKPIVDIDYIPITAEEIDAIEAVDGADKQRVLFTFLCLAKYRKIYSGGATDGWIDISPQDLFKLANSKVTSNKRRLEIIRSLYVGEQISLSKKITNTSIHVDIIRGDDAVFAVSDFRDLGYQYEEFHGKEFGRCSVCGRLIQKDGAYKKYCKECHDKYYNPLGDYYYIPLARRPIRVKCCLCGGDMLQNPELFWLDSTCSSCLNKLSGQSNSSENS